MDTCKNCRNYKPNSKEDINSGYCTFLLIGMDKDDGCIKGFNSISEPIIPTDTKLAKFYNLTRQTIAKYRKSDTNLYRAMVMYYNSKTQPQQ